MANPQKLHPNIRERKEARVSAASLAKFIISTPDKQETVLHDSRFMSAYVSPKYSEGIELIKAYALSLRRDMALLNRGKAALIEKSESPIYTPSQRDEARRCVEMVDRFDIGINVFGVNSAQIIETPKFDAMIIEGVSVSAAPSLLVGANYPPIENEKVGLVYIRPQKTPDPGGCKTEETKLKREDARRELAKYILTIGWMLLKQSGLEDKQIDTRKMSVWDIWMGENIEFPSDRVSRINRITAACDQINRLWDTIKPKPGDLVTARLS